jgi:hypothetical protein
MEHANPAAVLILLVLAGPILWSIWRAHRGLSTFIRKIPGIAAIDNAVGRAVELGRPISFTSGLANIGPLLFSCLAVLHAVARKAAVFKTKLIVPCSDPEVLVVSDAAVQNAYRAEGKIHRYEPANMRFLSTEQFAFASGYMGTMHRENVAAAFLFGTFAAESLILAEAGQQVGAVQVAATTSPEQVPFFLTTCDYTLIGEELFAAGAYLMDDPVQRGALRGQDIAKLVLLLLLTAGIAYSSVLSLQGAEKPAENPLSRFLELPWSKL